MRKFVGCLFLGCLFIWVNGYTKMLGGNWFPQTVEEFILDGMSLFMLMFITGIFFFKGEQ